MPFFGIGKPSLGANTMVGITEAGKREAQKFSSRGDVFAILAALNERSPQTVKQLAKELDMSTGETLQRIKSLMPAYVTSAGGDIER